MKKNLLVTHCSDLKTENLKYLNVKQALADLAHFIKTAKETIPGLQESKVYQIEGKVQEIRYFIFYR